MGEKARPIVWVAGATRLVGSVMEFDTGSIARVGGRIVYTPAGGGGGGGGGGAPTGAEYLTLATNGSLTHERVLTPSAPIAGADAGAGSTYTLSLSGWSGTTDGDMLYRNGTAVGTKTAAQVRSFLSLVVGTNVQAWDAGLDSLTAADATAGLPYVSGANTWSTATYSGMLSVVSGGWKVVGLRESGGQDLGMGAVADGEVLRRSGTSIVGAAIGSVLQAWGAIIDAIIALSSTGLIAKTGATTVAARTLTAGSGVTITNGDGVSGNPTISSSGGTNTDLDPTLGYMVDVQPAGATVSSRDATLTVRSASAAGNTSTLRRTRFTGSGVAMDWYFTCNVRLDMSFTFKARLFTGASIAATCRYKIGFGVGGFTTTDTETATSYILIRASTVLGDTTWKVVTYNGTTATTTDTTVAFAAATEYAMLITTSPTSITVTINGVDTVITATLPAASTDLTVCQCGLLGSTSAREWFFVGARLLVTYP